LVEGFEKGGGVVYGTEDKRGDGEVEGVGCFVGEGSFDEVGVVDLAGEIGVRFVAGPVEVRREVLEVDAGARADFENAALEAGEEAAFVFGDERFVVLGSAGEDLREKVLAQAHFSSMVRVR
jgi:hypothetical protein